MPEIRDLLRSYFSSAFNDIYRAFDPLPDALPEKQVHSVPPNVAHGNSPLDDLYYWFLRETIRALARSLFGIELDSSGVSPYTVSEGHNHDQDQDAAMAWWAPITCPLWFDEGAVTIPGAAVIDQLAEADIAWLPLTIPDGCSLAYFKLRMGTQAADDIAYVRVRLYTTASMNGSEVSATALLEVKSPDGGVSALTDRYIELSPISTDSLTITSLLRQGWARVSGFVAVAGDKAWVSEVQYGLREGV